MKRFLYWASSLTVGAIFGWVVLLPASYAMFPKQGDDPGPKVQYGGTPVELHFDSPAANFTMIHSPEADCAVISWAEHPDAYTSKNPTMAMDCNWRPR